MSRTLKAYRVVIEEQGYGTTELHVAVRDIDSALNKVRSYSWSTEINIKEVEEVCLLMSIEGLYE